MDINQCPNCQKQFDQDKRVSKQLPCGCVSCLKCFKNIYQFSKEIKCANHQQVFSINPEELQDYVIQQQVQVQDLPQLQEQFVDKELINEQFKCLQDQYVQKQNHNREILKVIQDRSQFMKHIQSLAIKEILETLINQFSMSKDKIKNLLKRLSEFQVVNEAQQQQQNLILGQQDPNIRQNPQGQLQQQFQQILSEIEEVKKDQWIDVQVLSVNIQRCMFGMFVYLSESSSGQLLTVNEAEQLIQNYFKQVKVQNSLSQGSKQLVQQKSYLQSQSNQQQLSQQSQDIEYYQQQSQVIDKQQCQNLVQVKQVSIPLEISLQEKQVNDARLFCEQIEQKLINISNDISFSKQECQLCQEQASLLKYVSGPLNIFTFGNLLQCLSKLNEQNVSIQLLINNPLNKLGLIEQSQILYQLTSVTDQQICLKLIQILNISKKQPQLQKAAANSITMLNYMNFDFTNINFSNLDLSTSDLSDTTFTSCNFANSNLTQANLRNAKFINCDLSNANLTSFITEYPHIFTGHTN